MGHTLLLYVSMLGAQGAEGQVVEMPAAPCASCQAGQMQYQAPPAKGPLGLGIWDRLRHRNDDEPGLFTRIQMRLFPHPSQPQPELGAPIADGATSLPPIHSTDVEPPMNVQSELPLPNPGPINPAIYNPSTLPAAVAQPVANSNRKYMDMSGHESDYSWVTGQIRPFNGDWIIEYDTPGTTDQFGGKLVLTHLDTKNLQNGDFVCVTGSLLGSGGPAAGVYHVRTINLIERPNQ